MSQYKLYSATKGPVAVASPIECSVPEYLSKHDGESSSSSRHCQKTASTPYTIDYSRFINEISSKRKPSQLREISKVQKKNRSHTYVATNSYVCMFLQRE